VYSYFDRGRWVATVGLGWPTRPVCANQPDSYGRLRRTPAGGVCRNYRPKAPTPEGDVRQISLGDGVYAYVDAADYEWLSQWTWHLCNGYAARYEKGKLILMHRQIMQPPKGMVVDHKNRNKLDNTRANLWVCTPRENACNRRKRRGAASRFRGVCHGRACSKWTAAIWFEGKLLHVGSFTDEVEAARAYDRKAVGLFGEKARVNFPEEWPPERIRAVYAKGPAGKSTCGPKRARRLSRRKTIRGPAAHRKRTKKRRGVL
jgi:hypothetical protein